MNSVCSIWNNFVSVLFRNGHFHNVVSTFFNVVKLNVENDNVVSTLSNVVHINIKIRCWTLWTMKYTTLFQRWFDVAPRRDVVSTKRQRWNNVEMFAGMKNVFLKISQNSQENTFIGFSFSVFLWISRNF